MEMWLTILVFVGFVASRPIEVRLRRAGRLSDRTLALLLVGRFPLLLVLFAVLGGVSSPLTLVLLGIAMLPSLFFYQFVLDFIREQPRP